MVDSCCPPPATFPLPASETEANVQLAAFARALGHPARVAIMRLLLRRDGCVVGSIVDALPLAQSTISQHLKHLKEAGLVRGTIDGPRVCYCVEPAALTLLSSLLNDLQGGR